MVIRGQSGEQSRMMEARTAGDSIRVQAFNHGRQKQWKRKIIEEREQGFKQLQTTKLNGMSIYKRRTSRRQGNTKTTKLSFW